MINSQLNQFYLKLLLSFLLKDPSSIAAASKQIISSSLENSKADLKIIGKENIINKSSIKNIDEVFSSSNNPLLSTKFLNDGAFTLINLITILIYLL